MITQRFYDGEHYVWCTPHFRLPNDLVSDPTADPLLSPYEMYRTLDQEAAQGGRECPMISSNAIGILRGAALRQRRGTIDDHQERQIAALVTLAEPADYRPLLYVIPYRPIATLARDPPPEDRAHPLFPEFLIENLPRRFFDVIQL